MTDCQSSPPCPLDTFPEGRRVVIKQLCDCPNIRGQLCALGLTPGTVVTVGRAGTGGRCLTVRGVALVLGQGICRKILARRAVGDLPRPPLGNNARAA